MSDTRGALWRGRAATHIQGLSESTVQPLRRSQRDRIATLLVEAYPAEVPAYVLAEHSLQYCARIKELRSSGWIISNRVEIRGGRKNGFFRLIHRPLDGSPAQPETLPLFGGRS